MRDEREDYVDREKVVHYAWTRHTRIMKPITLEKSSVLTTTDSCLVIDIAEMTVSENSPFRYSFACSELCRSELKGRYQTSC